MDEMETKPKPIEEQFKGKPVLRIPLVEEPDPATSWHWLSFGRNKAKAIVKYFEAIKRFAAEGD